MQPSSDSLHNHTQNIKWRLSFGVEGGCDVWTFVYFVKRGRKCVCVCVCVCLRGVHILSKHIEIKVSQM